MEIVDRIEACIETAIARGYCNTPYKRYLQSFRGCRFQRILDEAVKAGIEAGEKATPTPMRIKGYEPIWDGVCGFAWVNIAGNTAFGRWIKKNGHGRKSYYGGLDISIRHFNQSYERKLAMANRMAWILRGCGIKATAEGRLD
jgi:hypothetical protein